MRVRDVIAIVRDRRSNALSIANTSHATCTSCDAFANTDHASFSVADSRSITVTANRFFTVAFSGCFAFSGSFTFASGNSAVDKPELAPGAA